MRAGSAADTSIDRGQLGPAGARQSRTTGRLRSNAWHIESEPHQALALRGAGRAGRLRRKDQCPPKPVRQLGRAAGDRWRHQRQEMLP